MVIDVGSLGSYQNASSNQARVVIGDGPHEVVHDEEVSTTMTHRLQT